MKKIVNKKQFESEVMSTGSPESDEDFLLNYGYN